MAGEPANPTRTGSEAGDPAPLAIRRYPAEAGEPDWPGLADERSHLMQETPMPLPGLRGVLIGAVLATAVFGGALAAAGSDHVVLGTVLFAVAWLGGAAYLHWRESRRGSDAGGDPPAPDAPAQ